MMWFVAFLMLFTPSLAALRLHGIKKIDRSNLQSALFAFCLYSLSIVFLVNLVMFVTFPGRTVSFSPFDRTANSSIFHASFIVKYTLFAMGFSFLLPNLYKKRRAILDFAKHLPENWKSRKVFLRSRIKYDE